ncbi:MAG: hypothetical protein V4590_15130 [Bacteroidota bacterium]
MNELDPEKKMQEVIKAFEELQELALSVILETHHKLRNCSKEERRKSMESMDTRTLQLTLAVGLDFEEYEICEMAKELLEERNINPLDEII